MAKLILPLILVLGHDNNTYILYGYLFLSISHNNGNLYMYLNPGNGIS